MTMPNVRDSFLLLLSFGLLGLGSPTAWGQEVRAVGSLLDQVGFDQKLGAQLPMALVFQDEDGKDVRLGDLFTNRPVVLSMVYYNCPMLCTQVLNGLTRSLKPLALDVGKDFDVIVVSIDPQEKSDLSALKKRLYLQQYDREGTEAGWHFLTGDQTSITRLAQTIGFRYTYNPSTRLFAHAAGITLATPKGQVARYLFGLDFPPRDLQFGLVEASAGKVGSPVARILLLCYDYDAASGKYTFAIMRITRVLGSSTFLVLVVAVLLLLRRERRRAVSTADAGVSASLPPL